MRCFFNLIVLTVFCFALMTANFSQTGKQGSHRHSGGQAKPVSNPVNSSVTNYSNPQWKNKVITGTKNGVGLIADPAPRNLKPQESNVTKIMDPIPPKYTTLQSTGSGQVADMRTRQGNWITISPNSNPVAPT